MKSLVAILALGTIIYACDDGIPDLDFKQEMRIFVEDLSAYAKDMDPGFIIIPQNGQELITSNGDNEGTADLTYLSAIDAQAREDLFYGYNGDDLETPAGETEYMTDFLDIALENGKSILVTDYCFAQSKTDDSYLKNSLKGYISFAADHRELDNIPSYPAKPYGENSDSVLQLSDAMNFLYLINPSEFPDKSRFIEAVSATGYDLVIMDLFFDESLPFTSDDISQLKNKANGGTRLVICYLSIGEAEDYRYYWQTDWSAGHPSWIYEENPDWEGNFKVKYWDPEWQKIIFGNANAYLDRILETGFDGAYLDIIDAFEYFEER